jgi:hypothetical protein
LSLYAAWIIIQAAAWIIICFVPRGSPSRFFKWGGLCFDPRPRPLRSHTLNHNHTRACGMTEGSMVNLRGSNRWTRGSLTFLPFDSLQCRAEKGDRRQPPRFSVLVRPVSAPEPLSPNPTRAHLHNFGHCQFPNQSQKSQKSRPASTWKFIEAGPLCFGAGAGGEIEEKPTNQPRPVGGKQAPREKPPGQVSLPWYCQGRHEPLNQDWPIRSRPLCQRYT